MNIFSKQMTRKWAFSAALSLLLALAIGFSCIGYSAWVSAQAQIANIVVEYTTIAIPVPRNNQHISEQWSNVGGLTKEDGNIYWSDGTVTYSSENIAAVAQKAPQVLHVENSAIFSAALLDRKGLASGTSDQSQYNEAFDLLNYSFCVLAATCTQVTDDTIEGYWEGNTAYLGEVSYTADFEVIECLSLMNSYGDLAGQNIRIWGGDSLHCLTGENGQIPFEPGKTYILRGFFRDLPNTMQWDSSGEQSQLILTQSQQDPAAGIVRALDLNPQGIDEHIDLSLVEHEVAGKDVTYYYTSMDGSLPYYCEYTGDVHTFLDTEAGAVWKNTIIPWTKLNQNSASLVLTNNLDAIYNFNAGQASILEGRAFSEEEYTQGLPVCLVSAAFARHNGLTVGQTVTLDLYEAGMKEHEIHVEGAAASYYDYLYLRQPLTEDSRLNIKQTFEIVGIYTAPEFSDGQYNFTADTLFAPKKSVENAERYEEPSVAYLHALVIENGSQAAFEAHMAQQGMADSYLCLDMQFEDTRPALEAMADNAFRLMLIGAVVFLLVSLVGFYLQQARMKPVAANARRIGLSRSTIWRQGTWIFLVLSVLAAILGAFFSAAAFGAITQKLLDAELVFEGKTVLRCVGAELGILVFVSLLICIPLSNPNLMRTSRKHRRGGQ